jgi:hypothetical protein
VLARFAALRALVLLSFCGAMSLACTRVKVEDVRGPGGGGGWKAISCSRMNAKCFKTAERMCPNGYVFARGHEGSPKSVAKTAPPAAPESAPESARVTTLPAQDEWGGDMYSRKPGTILVQCASSPTRREASLSERDPAETSPP